MLACQYAYHYEMMYFSLLCRGSHVDLFKDKLGSAQLYSLKKATIYLFGRWYCFQIVLGSKVILATQVLDALI